MSPNANARPDRTTLLPTEDFRHSDIGNPLITGTVHVFVDGFDVTAGGVDIWGVRDEFNFVYIERKGDFDFIARIERLDAPNLYTKAGLMAREDLTESSRHVYFQVFSNNDPRNQNNGGYEYQYRQEEEGEMRAVYPARSEGVPEFPVAFPDVWIRLQRINDEFVGYCSTDGRCWKEYARQSFPFPEKLYFGMAVTSHEAKKIVTAKFRNIAELKN